MSHTYTKTHFHIVFSTKERQKLISKQIQPELWAYMSGICGNVGIYNLGIGGIDNHIHALLEIPPTMALAKAVSLLKSNSSRWMRRQNRMFAWQEGYGAFSVSASMISTVTRYIRDQEKRHRRMTFEREYVSLLDKHGVKYDPIHLWD